MTWYNYLAVIVWGLFILKTLLSWLIADFDTDIDFDADGEPDVGFGDIISFKGLVHFLMGFSVWLVITQFTVGVIAYYDYAIAFIIGIVFVVLLYYLYKFMLKLNYQPTNKEGQNLVGTEGKVYLTGPNNSYVLTIPTINGTTQIDVYSNSSNFHIGDNVLIREYKNGKYFI